MSNCKLQLTSLAKNASFFGHTEYGGFARCSTSGAACSEFGSSFLQGKYRTYIVIEQTLKKCGRHRFNKLEPHTRWWAKANTDWEPICTGRIQRHSGMRVWQDWCVHCNVWGLIPFNQMRLLLGISGSSRQVWKTLGIPVYSCDSLTAWRRSDFLVT